VLSVKGCESGNGSSGSVLGLLETGWAERAQAKSAVVALASESMTQTDVDRETYENSDVSL
jgi:hypothetical protein